MEYSGLQEMIECLEYGTRLHISVVFFGSCGNRKTQLLQKSTIHSKPICDKAKRMPDGFPKCVRCRNAAIRKAMQTKSAFGGLCVNGIYEYCRPVSDGDNVACIIFIGNIFTKNDRINTLLEGNEQLKDTMELNFEFERCEKIGNILEGHIRLLLSEYSDENIGSSFNPLIENMKNYIELNLMYNVTLGQLAKIFHYNEKYLGRLFKNKMGISFNEYINLRRIEAAEEMLRRTGDSVMNISLSAGFNNVTYFNRIFKKHYHLTPVEYRKKYKNQSMKR